MALPPELGEESLSNLSVQQGSSEPAAYALVALKSFDFTPSDDERVFDFGGGTTDFDFGIYRGATGKKERRFNYVIEHFGAGGDRFSGGENLLELLAFSIFKKNKTALLKNGIQFEKHPEEDEFAGSEQLFSSSQEAKINTKILSEMLRPFWEGDKETCGEFLSSGNILVNLTDLNENVQVGFELDVDVDELNTLLSNRIERGIVNFFEALRLAFSHRDASLDDIDQIKIFLAGNSSQSHFVSSLFEKQIALQKEKMELAEDKDIFEVFQPLGADSDPTKPTGKTGVAFGLIESREGGKIKVIDHNMQAMIRKLKEMIGIKERQIEEQSSDISKSKNIVEDLKSNIKDLNGQASKRDKTIQDYKHDLACSQEQNQALSSKVEFYRENFEDDIRIYKVYSELTEETKNSLKNIFKNTSMKGIIACGIKEKNIINLWDYAMREVVNNKPDSAAIVSLFESLFAQFILAFPMYKLQNIQQGEEFDTQSHIRHNNSSRVTGSIDAILLQGYINTKTDKVIKQAVVVL